MLGAFSSWADSPTTTSSPVSRRVPRTTISAASSMVAKSVQASTRIAKLGLATGRVAVVLLLLLGLLGFVLGVMVRAMMIP